MKFDYENLVEQVSSERRKFELNDDLNEEELKEYVKGLEGKSKYFYDYLIYDIIAHVRNFIMQSKPKSKLISLLEALIKNDNIQLSEEFFSFYNYFLKEAIRRSYETVEYVYDDQTYYHKIFNFISYTRSEADKICSLIDEKQKKQSEKGQINQDNSIALTDEDYQLLKVGLPLFYHLISGSEEHDEMFEDNKLLQNMLFYGNVVGISGYNASRAINNGSEEKPKVGPFFNLFDVDKVWKLFYDYSSFDNIRNMIKEIKSTQEKNGATRI